MTDNQQITPGFVPLGMKPNPYVDSLGPLYGKQNQAGSGITVGMPVELRHCNPGNTCHGGMICTLADMLLLLNANVQSGIHRYMLTVNLSCDFLGPAPLGSWLYGTAEVLRASKNMIFANGIIRTDEQVVARVNGIFKPIGEDNTGPTLNELLRRS